VPFEVVRVFVAPAVSLLSHEPGRRIAKMQRHRIDPRFGEIVLQLTEPALQRI